MMLDNPRGLAIFRSVQAKGVPFAQVFYGSSVFNPTNLFDLSPDCLKSFNPVL